MPEGDGDNQGQGQNQGPQGNSATGSTETGTQGTSTGDEPKTPEGKTFTEEQLDRSVGKRAKEAEKSAKQATEAAIAEQLGVPSKRPKDHRRFTRSRRGEEVRDRQASEQNESIKKDGETKASEVQGEHHE